MEAEPSSGVSMPLDIETVAADPVQASERGVEFFAQGLWLTGSIALDEPIAVSMPFAEDIDRIVELSGYLAETITAIIDGHPQSQIEDLMPWRFRKTSSPSP